MNKQANVLFLFVLAIVFVPAQGCERYEKYASRGIVTCISSGKLERFKDNKWTGLKPGSKLFSSDKLRTDENGVAVITLDGIGRFMIGNVTEYVLGSEPADFRTTLIKGSVWFFSLMKPGGRMSIETANAVSGARGTAFSVIADATATDVCTCMGIVDVTVRNRTPFAVQAGQYAIATKDGHPGGVKDGKKLLSQIRKGAVSGYSICAGCHHDDKAKDISIQTVQTGR